MKGRYNDWAQRTGLDSFRVFRESWFADLALEMLDQKRAWPPVSQGVADEGLNVVSGEPLCGEMPF